MRAIVARAWAWWSKGTKPDPFGFRADAERPPADFSAWR